MRVIRFFFSAVIVLWSCGMISISIFSFNYFISRICTEKTLVSKTSVPLARLLVVGPCNAFIQEHQLRLQNVNLKYRIFLGCAWIISLRPSCGPPCLQNESMVLYKFIWKSKKKKKKKAAWSKVNRQVVPVLWFASRPETAGWSRCDQVKPSATTLASHAHLAAQKLQDTFVGVLTYVLTVAEV